MVCLLVALPVLFLIRYLFIVAGASAFWSVGFQDGAQVHAANAVFGALLGAGTYALWRFGVIARGTGVTLGVLAICSVLGPLAR